jgi:hypothetical protein
MAQQIINIGAAPNDGSGDSIRVSFDKVNKNFAELYRNSGSPTTGTGYTGSRGYLGYAGSVGYSGSQGPVGPQGIAINLLGRVATYNSLPTSGNSVGDAWFVAGDSNVYLWDTASSSWNSIGQIVGYTGSVGAAGYTGSRGAGYTGSTGYRGSAGTIGYTGSAGSGSGLGDRLTNGSKTVVLGSAGTLTLPAQGLLINVNQITAATINRAGANADTTAIQDAWNLWYSDEWAWRLTVQEDQQTGGPTRPWYNKPSWEGYPLLMNFNSAYPSGPLPGGGPPPNPNLAPLGKTAVDSYLAYKELVSDIDIVSGNKAFSFENTGELSLPGTLVFKDAANAKIVLKTTDVYGYELEPSEYDKAWTFGITGDLTLPVGGDIKDSNGVSVLGGSSFNGTTAALTLTGKIPYTQPVFIAPPVTFTRPNNSINTVDVIDTGVTFKRGNNGALFNSAAGETSWQQSQSPLGTEWNVDGWGDLADVKTRTYTTFNNAIQDWGAANIHHKEFVMHDKINNKYYTFKFSWWQANGGGGAVQSMDEKSGFTYVRRLINTDPTVVFVHPAGNANTNQDDIGPGLSITRGTNGGGIYNAQEDNEWDPDTTPYGTLWNDEGWDDFADITTRTWKPFFTAVHGRLGDEIVGRELLMKDTGNHKYYLIKFTEWGVDNGGSFAYTRREVNPTGTKLGITFADGSKQLTANTLGNLKVVDGNVIYNAAQPGHGAEIRSDVNYNFNFGVYYWNGNANWITQGNEGVIEFNSPEVWQQDFPRFLNDLGRWLTATVSINSGPVQTITDWWSGGFTTKAPPATDPTLVNELRFNVVFRSKMYMGGETSSGFYLDKRNENFRAEAQNIYLSAGESQYNTGSIYASSWATVELRNNHPDNSIQIITDGNNTSKTWYFGANGKLQLPPGGDIVASDGTTSVLGGGGGGGSSLTNGTKTVSLGSDGNLTFADAGGTFFGNGYLQSGTNGTNIGIKSWDGRQKVFVNETNVTIQTVTNSSQAYDWTFGKDGSITFPSNKIKPVAESAITIETNALQAIGGALSFGRTDYKYLATSTPINFVTGAWTIEAWIYPRDTGENNIVGTSTTPGVNIYFGNYSGNRIITVQSAYGSAQQWTINYTENQWNHFAIAFDGTLMTVWVNGVRSVTGTQNYAGNWGNNVLTVGANPWANRYGNNMKLTQLRVVAGSAVYNPTSATITVPTSRLTSISGAQLLLNAVSSSTAFTDTSGIQTITNNGVEWISDSPQKLSVPHDWTFGADGKLTIPGDIYGKTNSFSLTVGLQSLVPNITVDAADGTDPSWRLFILDSLYPNLGTDVTVGANVTTAWGTPVTATVTEIQHDIGYGRWIFIVDQNITTGFLSGPKTVTFGPGVKTWQFGVDGSITFPTQSTVDYRNRTDYTTGPTLQLKDNGTDDAVLITGPAATAANPAAKRLVIQGQPGWRGWPVTPQPSGAEGGDVYIWAGHGGEGSDYSGDGGDAKLRGGNGGMAGGYVRLEAGAANATNGTGGFLDLNAGDALNGTVSYNTAQGGNVEIRGGRGYGHGGVVNIHTAITNNWDHQWTFGTDGSLTLPSGGSIVSTNGSAAVLSDYAGYNQFFAQSDGTYVQAGTAPTFTTTITNGGSGYGNGGSQSATSGGSGTGLVVSYGYGLQGQVSNIGIVNPGLGYQDGDVLTMTAGNGNATFVLHISQSINTWQFGLDGKITLPKGSTIGETTTTTVIAPPGAAAGQSLVLRGTSPTGITSNHPGGFAPGDTITITVNPNNGISVTGTIDYTFTGDFGSASDLGRGTTGTLTFNNQSDAQLTWTIPALSPMTTFTFTLTNGSGIGIGGMSALTLTRTGSSEDSHIHLVAGNPVTTDIYLGDDDQYVKIAKNGGDVVVGTSTNTNHWTFGTDGKTTLPNGTAISNIDPNNIRLVVTGDSVGDGTVMHFLDSGTSPNKTSQLLAAGMTVNGPGVVNGVVRSVDAAGMSLTLKSGGAFQTGGTYIFTSPSLGTKVKVGFDTAQVGHQAVFTQDLYGNTQTGAVAGVTYINVGSNAQLRALIDVNSLFGNNLYNLLTPITITYSDATTQTFSEVRITNISTGGVMGFGYNDTTAGHNFPITLTSVDYEPATTSPEWKFNADGVLTLPNGTNIYGDGLLKADAVGGFEFTSYIDANGGGEKTWKFGADGKLLLPGGNAQIVVENYGVRIGTGNLDTAPSSHIRIGGADHAFEIFGGPPGYSWKFDANSALKLPNAGELRPSTSAYDAALAAWEDLRSGYITTTINNNLIPPGGWPMVNWYPTGTTAQGYIDFLLNARTLQNTPGATLIIQPAMSVQFYNDMRAALIAIRDSYNTSTKSVSISSAYGKSWNFGADGSLTLPDASVIASYKPVTVIAQTSTTRTIIDQASAAYILFTETVDTANAYANGVFTAPYTGYYQFNVSIYFSTSVTLNSGSFFLIDSSDSTKTVTIMQDAWSGRYLHYSTVVQATAGDTIHCFVLRNASGANIDLASGCRLTIHRVSIS